MSDATAVKTALDAMLEIQSLMREAVEETRREQTALAEAIVKLRARVATLEGD